MFNIGASLNFLTDIIDLTCHNENQYGRCYRFLACPICLRCNLHTYCCQSVYLDVSRPRPIVQQVEPCCQCSSHTECQHCGACTYSRECADCGSRCCGCEDCPYQRDDHDDEDNEDDEHGVSVPTPPPTNSCPECRKYFHNCKCAYL